ncbi:LysR substrate-binding domain-containing protein [Actinomadura sp. DC4]|uniref:LysR substrate-binding domain-containing protein n=1 Tax=Actinomadura sp. DC4 TaxID=3055069 RepID=UPI0025AF103B|nr:LysR substrate-binding domain-containing protein [Actinomadura sp. DC4]MDN3352433.1 LysR substrate-binding domain-containing protein [Actinomadura sp. DC4]
MTDHIRFGYHGSRDLPTRLVRAAGGDREFSLIEYDVADPFRALRARSLDVMITKFAPSEPDLAYSAILDTDARAAIVGAAHPLADRASVSIEELADYDGFECPGTFPPQVWDEVVPPVTPGGRTVRRRHSMATTAALMDLVVRGEAVHISLLSLADVAPPRIRVIPIHDLPPAPVTLAWIPSHASVEAFVADAEAAFLGSRR